MSSTGPEPILLLPDGILVGRSNVVSVTSEAQPYTGLAVPDADNVGDLYPEFEAVSVSADYDLTLSIQRAGGVYAQAEWLWRSTSDATSATRGVDEIRYLTHPHDPFWIEASLGGSMTTYCVAACYARRIGKVLLACLPAPTTAHVRYREIGSAYDDWSTESVLLDPSTVAKTGNAQGIEVLEMADGSLRMLVLTGSNATANNDVDVYASQDGLTWALASRRVLSRAKGSQINCLKFRAAVSGDWVRFVVVDDNGGAPRLDTFVSSDCCATFTWLDGAAITGGNAPTTNGQTLDPYGHVDIEGVGDTAGAFILVYRDSSTSTDVAFRSAARDADTWAGTFDLLGINTRTVMRCALFRDSTRMYFVAVTTNAGLKLTFLHGTFANLDEATLVSSTASGYNGESVFAQWQDQVTLMPANLVGCESDGGFLLAWGLCDPDSSGAPATGCGLVYGQRWTTRSLWENALVQPPLTSTYSLLGYQWESVVGLPGRNTGLPTWVQHIGASGVQSWAADRVNFGSSANGPNGRVYWAFNDGAAPSSKWASGSFFSWVVGAMTTTTEPPIDERVGVRIRALGATAGVSLDVSFRHSNASLIVYDNGASQALATFTLAALSDYYAVRVALAVSGATYEAEVAVAGQTRWGDASGWSSARVSLSSQVSGVTSQCFEWGALVGAAGQSSMWRRFEYAAASTFYQHRYQNPRDQRGMPVGGQPCYTLSGVYTRWTGGAGFEGDVWTAAVRHDHEVENLFLPSLQARWAGTSLTTQTIVLTGASTGRRSLEHDFFALLGTSSYEVTVDYNDGDSWGSPAATTTFSNALVTSLRVGTVAGEYVDVDGETLASQAYVGKYARFDFGGAGKRSFEILRQNGQRLHLSTSAALTSLMAAGTSCVIHDDRFVRLWPARRNYTHMRVTLHNPAPGTGAGTTTATSDVRGAVLLAGITVGFPAELDWEFVQREVPNQEVQDGYNGSRWGARLAAPRRAIEARVVGDASDTRAILARHLRNLPQFGVRPMVFSPDSNHLQTNALYVRFVGEVEHEEAGWRQDASTGRWYPVGDLALTFEEEL